MAKFQIDEEVVMPNGEPAFVRVVVDTEVFVVTKDGRPRSFHEYRLFNPDRLTRPIGILIDNKHLAVPASQLAKVEEVRKNLYRILETHGKDQLELSIAVQRETSKLWEVVNRKYLTLSNRGEVASTIKGY